ncbi:MAG: sarcosine/dimethylglycine N-methyltransferase [Paracoccaceae bacterium]|jgi:sarcosine/dimethylglycine N-methyltransferase
MTSTIKDMQLYPSAERILVELRHRGYADSAALDIETLAQLDQLHYHGTDALDQALGILALNPKMQVLEIGSGWGGPSRYLAHRSNAQVHALELQPDFHEVASGLTARAGLADRVSHIRGDFHEVEITPAFYDAVVSWLALYHIPQRQKFITKSFDVTKPGGTFFSEDLIFVGELDPNDTDDLHRNLFTNSLVSIECYQQTLEVAGYQDVKCVDMTQNWKTYTADRLVAFRKSRPAVEAIHGASVYEELEVFYAKVVEYFEKGVIGGVQAFGRKPG